MEGFTWAESSLSIQEPHQLQQEGVNVYFAPMIAPGEKVVNLANGHVERFMEGEHRPQSGYYAEFASLARYCRYHGLPLTETDGQVSVLPATTKEAGDPLLHGEAEEA